MKTKSLIEKNNKIVITVVIVLIILLIILAIIGLIKKSSPYVGIAKDNDSNTYNVKKNKGEMEGTRTYSNDNIKNEHCIEGICITDVVFYYLDNRGRIDYKIVNKNSDISSGYLEADFDFVKLVIPYVNLEPNAIKSNSSYYEKKHFNIASDYKLRLLSEEESKNIIVGE